MIFYKLAIWTLIDFSASSFGRLTIFQKFAWPLEGFKDISLAARRICRQQCGRCKVLLTAVLLSEGFKTAVWQLKFFQPATLVDFFYTFTCIQAFQIVSHYSLYVSSLILKKVSYNLQSSTWRLKLFYMSSNFSKLKDNYITTFIFIFTLQYLYFYY